MANTFIKVVDRLRWVSEASSPAAHAAGGSVCSDLRSDVSRNPFVYQLVSATSMQRFNIVTKAWSSLGSPGLGGTFGAGAGCVFTPSQRLKGAIGAGCTSQSIVTTTAITAVGANMLANRGGSGEYGFKLRIVGKTAGKTEERWIVANTEGVTPTMTLNAPLTFVPVLGDQYELLAGAVYALSAGAIAATSFRSFEVATNAWANGGTSGLPTPATDSSLVALDEQYTPYDCEPGDGFIKGSYVYDSNFTTRHALTATNSGASSLTGQAASGDAAVLENEYRNFQLRIVEDTTTPAAVGQRRIIGSHTAGPSPLYTLGSAWDVTPSADAKFVIEYPNLILLRTAANSTVYTYNYNDAAISNGTSSINPDSWSTSYFATAPAACAAGGVWMPAYGIRPDPDKNARHSHIFFRRGASSTIDLLDIAGAANGAWSGAVVHDGAVSMTTGTSGCYSPFENEGRFFYLNGYSSGAVNQIYRFDVKNRVLTPMTPTTNIQSGTAAVGNRMAAYCAFTDDEKYDVVFLLSHLSSTTQELFVLV